MPRPGRTDVALALVLTACGLAEALLGLTGRHEPLAVVLLVPLTTGAVLVRRTRPPVAVAAISAALLGQALLGSDLPGGFTEPVSLVLVVYAVGSRTRGRTGVALLGVVLLAGAGVVALGDARAGNFVYLGTVMLAAWFAGYLVRLADERSVLLAERAAQHERNRIAGELHDVVSHHVSGIVIQAGAERRDLPEGRTADALAAIEQQGRQTLVELRRLLGVLRVDVSTPLAPQPGVADIDELVKGCNASGLAVSLRSEGTPRAVDEGVGLGVYRVVQEALTNVRKHGEAPEATVTLRWPPRAVEVEVVNPGHTRRRRLLPGAGLGLRAMQERVATYGGRLAAGPTDEGFRVLATFPEEPR